MGGGGGSNEIKETSQEKAAAEIAMKEWNRYQDIYVPLENAWMDDIRVTAEEKAKIAGEAGGMVTKRYDDAQASLSAPGSGKFNSNLTTLNVERGKTAGRSMATASQLADDQHYAGLQAAVNVGRGQATDAQLGMSDLAAQSVKDATSDAVADWRSRDDTLSAIGGVAGMAGYNLWKKKTP